MWHLCDVLPPAVIAEKFLSAVFMMTGDRVPNVRLVVAKVLMKLRSRVDPRITGQINLRLNTLAKDKDADVRFFASHPVDNLGPRTGA
jgi:hypothetical protein